MANDYCLILTTCGNRDEAEKIAELLVTRKLAACVQITPVSSRYVWKGALKKDDEHLLLIKTAEWRYSAVEQAIRENHSYEVPEIVQLPIERGLDRYLSWVEESTR